MLQAAAMLRRNRSWSKDYHGYVFRNGKLIGDFDNMYRYAAEVPWHQDTVCGRWYYEGGCLLLKTIAPWDSVLEIGCGLGYISAKLQALAPQGTVEGCDVSPLAIRKARRLHPGIRFYVEDVTKRTFRPHRRYDLVVVKNICWYIVGHFDTALGNITACVKPHGHLYLCEPFPALEKPFVGREILPNPDALLARLHAYELVATALLGDYRQPEDGPVLHFLGKKR